MHKEWRFEVQDNLSNSRVYPQTVLAGLCSKSLTQPILEFSPELELASLVVVIILAQNVDNGAQISGEDT